MPIYKQSTVRGRLFVKIEVEMPKLLDLDEKDLAMLDKLLSTGIVGSKIKRKPKAGDTVITMLKGEAKSPFGAFGAPQEEEGYNAHPFSRFFS